MSRKNIDVMLAWETLAIAMDDNCPCGGADARINALWRNHLADPPGEQAANEDIRSLVECWYDRIGWAREELTAEELAGKGIIETEATLISFVVKSRRDMVRYYDNPLLESPATTVKKYAITARRIHEVCAHRALLVTSKGYIGLAPWKTKRGDSVYVLHGGRTPYILRNSAEPGKYKLVGESYVYGIMGGEALKMRLDVNDVCLI
jgi:hypothetical protein